MNEIRLRTILISMLAAFVLTLAGCGTVQEGMEEDSEMLYATSTSEKALLEYRIDSLAKENSKLQQQVEKVSAENKNLTARNVELESGSGTPSPATVFSPARVVNNPAYESALTKFRNRNYQEAADEFATLLSIGISNDLADNCRYWIGEADFAQKKYGEAIQQFESVIAIAGSDKADDAQLMLGNAHVAMGNRTAAKEAYQTLITNYPTSPLVKRARSKMKGL